ncbi:MAG TPA: AcvB/VirJ family lysyl-phosphatidylglycerol hydrolase [Pseudomonadales bacterium]|nr:AcvB/VirJ family lysyl-phosphatidylglycerol hydrolase [Pseudomonadales bacterium]
MKNFFLIVLAALLSIFVVAGIYCWRVVRSVDPVTVPYAELGDTLAMNGGQRGVVIVLSDKKYMSFAIATAKIIAATGRVAALVDMDAVFARVLEDAPDCLEQVTLLDVYAQHLQQTFQFDHFDKPALIGFGSAGFYVKLLLAQAPAGIFSTGISAQEQDALSLPASLCGAVSQQVMWKSPTVPVVISGELLSATPRADQSSGLQQWFFVLRNLFAEQTQMQKNGVGDLPLVELPQEQGGAANYFVVIISGDGGWANIDKDIAGALGEQGVAVVGWNSLRYFWEAKDPDVMSADLARVIRYYQRHWGRSKVVLVGFSLGADVLPFMVSHLPADVQQAVSGLALLSPSQDVDFQFHVSDWLESDSGDPNPLLPEMEKISRIPLLCVYGDDDDETLCQQLTESSGRHIVRLPGDHHFDGDYNTVTQLLLSQFPVSP